MEAQSGMVDTLISRTQHAISALFHPVEVSTTRPYELTDDELRKVLDARSRLYLGISGDEFLERMNAGTLPSDAGTEHLVMLARALPETAA